MKQYIHIFKNNDDYEDFVYGLAYKEPFVSNTKIKEETSLKDSYRLNYNLTKLEKERKNFLTFDIEGDGDIVWKSESSAFTKTISYKKNDDDWIQITSTADENPPTISVVTGDKIQFKGNGNYFHSGLGRKVSFDGTTCQFNLHGNILSLYNEDETVFPFLSSVTTNWTFRGMFEDITGLTDASLLYMPEGKTGYGMCYRLFKNCSSLKYAPELPATILNISCYEEMFYGCSNLVKAPELPATTLARSCYSKMFGCCGSLRKIPSRLPASALTEYCYADMFSGCTLITTAPELPSTTLENYCYQEMFQGCTSLTTVPELPATTLKTNCYRRMFNNCTSITKPPILPASEMVEACYMSMFNGCTALKYTPELPSETLASGCYESMFADCTSLVQAPELPATILSGANNCYRGMFSGCTLLVTPPELPATTMAQSCYSSMFVGCTSLTTPPELPATTLAQSCYYSMFAKCRSLTTAPELPATTLANGCYSDMFAGCHSLTTAPELPATTLANGCYYNMFRNSSSLNYIKCLATDISANNSRYYWVDGVAANGVFVKDSTITSWPTGASGIPTKWLVIDDELSFYEEPSIVNSDNEETFVLYSDADWQVYECPNWLYLSITSGTDGLYNIEISASTNTSEDKRSGNIVFKTTDNVQTKTMSVIQLPEKEKQPLTIIATSGGTLYWKADNTAYTCTIQYSKNGGEWTSITSSTGASAPSISLVKGDYVEFKGDNESYTQYVSTSYSNFFSGNVIYDLYGNIMSTIDSTGFTTATTLTGNRNFRKFFSATLVKKANNLVLPALTLSERCYNEMFINCRSLITAPELPATTLIQNCYRNMFYGCTSLVTAPSILPATTLTEECYREMFRGCTSLSQAPELPATTLAQGCYNSMFAGCTSLTTPPELPAITLGSGCYQSMFSGCTSLVQAPELPATILSGANNCYNGMFINCTSLTTAPELPATTLANSCYFHMFQGCESLTTAPELHATTLATQCYDAMFSACTSLTTAPELPAITLAYGCYSSMFRCCTSLTQAPELPATILEKDCYNSMFYGCTNLIKAPALPATILSENCYTNMFNGCNSLTKAPELPATILQQRCYFQMFNGCSKLNNIKCLAEDIGAYDSTYAWVEGVASAGTFTMSNNGAPWVISINGIPEGWNIQTESGGTFIFTNPKTLIIAHTGEQKTLDVYSNTSWAITDYPDWCSFDKTSGTNIETLNLTFTENSGTTERTDNIIVQTTDSSYTYTVSVTQKAEGEESKYLTFNITSAGNLYWKASNPYNTRTIEYCKNGGSWVSITSTTGGVQIPVDVGDVIWFRGDNTAYAGGNGSTVSWYNCFSGTTTFTMNGNLMSLINSTNFSTLVEFTASYTFANFFRYCSNITDIGDFVLPATTLQQYCYMSMFKGCKKLINAPALPATTLAPGCYRSLYSQCTSLITAPDLLAPILVTECYQEMFDGATKVNYIKCLATNVTGSTYTSNWVRGITSSGTFVKNSSTSWGSGNNGIPSGWSVINDE